MRLRGFEDFRKFVGETPELKRCIVRCDLNIPSSIRDLSRVYAIKSTVEAILDLGLGVVLISHYKRPKPEDRSDQKFSLSIVRDSVSEVLGRKVQFVEGSVFEVDPSVIDSEVVLLENLRFYDGETQNDDNFARILASYGDVYVNEAFSVSHRAHASVCAITKYIPSFAGISLQNEVRWLSKLLQEVDRPYTAIIGGSKVSTKIDVLRRVSQIADNLVITGAMANTFLAARGFDMQSSVIEKELLADATEIMKLSKAKILLPLDFMVSADIETTGTTCKLGAIPQGNACFDIGNETVKFIQDVISQSKTLLWNGAIGAFEFANFRGGTDAIAQSVAELTKSGKIASIIGGGETVASLGCYKDDMSFVSTAGGAFLEFVAGFDLPGLLTLQAR
ncbi:MAG: phosphoglycerate kinase [Holosporales bacterium]|nr:phosphoglycerate kinase [Holosporales bacterium]